MKLDNLIARLQHIHMPVWHSQKFTLDTLNEMTENTMSEWLGVTFTEIGESYLRAAMPVNEKTMQPYGILHGGASVALAETLGSVASALVIDPEKSICVGMEINANHLRSASKGQVHGIATPLHLGKSSHVWEIRIFDDAQKLICVSRHTVAILDRKQWEAGMKSRKD